MTTAAPDNLSDRIKAIIRRDLKFGPDIKITDEMPFFGTDADIDSLDILLLLTSIEKEFGIKVPSEKVGREIFENVGTLVRFIDSQRTAGAPGAGPVAAAGGDYLSRLPHQEPFRFVSRLGPVKPGESAEGFWAITGQEAFFTGHFPGNPIVPGVLVAEALAQVSGLALPIPAAGMKMEGRLAHVDVRFEQAVTPPVEISLKSRLVRTMGTLSQFEVQAGVGQKVIARGMLAISVTTS